MADTGQPVPTNADWPYRQTGTGRLKASTGQPKQANRYLPLTSPSTGHKTGQCWQADTGQITICLYPTSKLSCGRPRGFDGSQRLARDTFPSRGRKAGADHSPYQLTYISWQDDGSPIIDRWLAAVLRPHYGKMMACRYSADGWLPPCGRVTSADVPPR